MGHRPKHRAAAGWGQSLVDGGSRPVVRLGNQHIDSRAMAVQDLQGAVAAAAIHDQEFQIHAVPTLRQHALQAGFQIAGPVEIRGYQADL